MPLRVGTPSEASPPDKGGSTAIFITSPLAVVLVIVPVPDIVSVAVIAPVDAGVSVAAAPAWAGVSVAAGTAVAVGSAVVPQALSSMLSTTMRAIRANPFLEDFIFRDSPPKLIKLE